MLKSGASNLRFAGHVKMTLGLIRLDITDLNSQAIRLYIDLLVTMIRNYKFVCKKQIHEQQC